MAEEYTIKVGVEMQMLSYIIASGDHSIIEDNALDETYFPTYKDEFNFIENHYKQYGNIPDKETYVSHFNDSPIYEISESRQYLINSLIELKAYHEVVPITNEFSEEACDNVIKAVTNLIPKLIDIRDKYEFEDNTIDINKAAYKRYESWIERTTASEPYMYATGFKELDEKIGGLRKSEELCVIYARTGNCKTWVTNRILQYNNHIGRTVGIFSPEMSAETLGYRVDSLNGHFDNFALTTGRRIEDSNDYKEYASNIASDTNKKPFYYCNPKTFDHNVTISKLKKWVTKHKIEILAIDGISYITDERAMRGDSKTTRLTNISEDLMTMSIELQIPIIVVAQANRTGVSETTPELDSIRDSDGISHNSTLAISVKLNDNYLTMKVTKARYTKNGESIKYKVDLNHGYFEPQMIDASESFLDLNVKDRGVRNRQPLTRQESTIF